MRLMVMVLVVGMLLAGCGTQSEQFTPNPVFGSPAGPSAAAPMQGAPGYTPGVVDPSSPNFRVAVIVDTQSQQVSREQAGALVAEASGYLRPFSPIGLEMVDFAEDAGGGSTADIAGRYVASRSAPLPNGLVIFSSGDNGKATEAGGYGFGLPVQGGFTNDFVSPVGGASQVYVAVVDVSHAKPGTGLYAAPPTHYAASMIVHGLLHNFAPGGDTDRYGTDECNAKMGYPPGFRDLQQAQYYNDLCPSVYEEFTKSHQP